MVIDGNTRAGDDERYMLEAVKEAARAAEEGEVPVGAVIVKDGQRQPKRARCPSVPS